MYFINYQNHQIMKLDLNQPREEWKEEVFAGGAAAGHRDGSVSEALFRYPCGIWQDSDDNIYIADEQNHCIRRITPENQVETVLGIPGMSGWKDGNKEEALFNRPRGLCIDQNDDIYVCDYYNGRIRKLSIN
jgi:sugar lactone lactonase YvrE